MSRASLCDCKDSPFVHLCASGIDQALINATGLDHATFKDLLDEFEPVFWGYQHDMKTGMIVPRHETKCTRDIDAVGGLVLVLMCSAEPLEQFLELCQ